MMMIDHYYYSCIIIIIIIIIVLTTKYDWLLTPLIYGLNGCFQVQTVRFDLSDYKHL